MASPNDSCRACGGSLVPSFDAVIMGELTVTYHRCTRCASLMLLDPHWLDRAYSRIITPDPDFGALRRTLFMDRVVRRLRGTGIIPRKYRSLDYGCGTGMMVRLQRDRRADAWGYDHYATPRFAEEHCSRTLPPPPFDLITCIEVIEHTENPSDVLVSLRTMLKDGGLLLVSTELVDGQSDIAKWSYLALEHGQHITFFSKAGFAIAVEAAGFTWVSSLSLLEVPLLHLLAPRTRRRFPLRCALLRLRQRLGEAIYSSDLTI